MNVTLRNLNINNSLCDRPNILGYTIKIFPYVVYLQILFLISEASFNNLAIMCVFPSFNKCCGRILITVCFYQLIIGTKRNATN